MSKEQITIFDILLNLSTDSFSALRFLALTMGIGCWSIIGFRLQRTHNDVTNIFFLLPVGLTLILVAASPSVVDLPAHVLNLRGTGGGRLLALLIIAVSALWFLFIHLFRSATQLRHDHQDLKVEVAAQSFLMSKSGSQNYANGILVIIPAFNEENNLANLLSRFPKTVEGKRIFTLVVNDGSSDETGRVALENNVWLVNHPGNYGGGMAVRTGYRVAQLLGFKFAVTMDADGQHRPEELPTIASPIISGDADFVIGSRQLGQGENYSILRMIGVKSFSLGLTILMRRTITDCASGYRGFSVDGLSRLKILATQYHTAETIIMALKQNLRIMEVPITIQRRQSGSSKKGHDFFYAVRFLGSIFSAWWR